MEPLALCNLLVIAFTCGFSIAGFRSSYFEGRFIFWPEGILGARQYYRLVTSAFLHRDGLHLGMNMVVLYLFGAAIEERFGPVQFLVIYFAAIVGGSLLALLIHRHHDYKAYGASGGVFGIVYAHIFLFPGGSIYAYFIPIGIPSWLYAIVYLLASFYGMQKKMDNVGHDAHLGGALVGLYTATALQPWVIRASPILFSSVSVGTILLFLYMTKNPLFLPLEGIRLGKPRPAWGTLAEHKRVEQQVDAILAKISEKGIHSLTPGEQAILRQTSAKFQKRAARPKPESGLTL